MIDTSSSYFPHESSILIMWILMSIHPESPMNLVGRENDENGATIVFICVHVLKSGERVILNGSKVCR